jgi:ligand-binding sensor domain-containing protein/serine phosphatase RsbU (regulator of sigma subunit)
MFKTALYRTLRGALTLIVTGIFVAPVFSQQLNFQTYSVEDGLPQSTVFEIFQDRDGYLWIGTDGGGLCRFDGYRFKAYGKNEGLRANVVRRIAQDNENALWIATNNGLYRMKEGKIIPVNAIANNASIYFLSVMVDHAQNVWACTSGKGVYRLSHDTLGYRVTQYNTSNGLSGDYIFDVCEDSKGKIWLASYGNGLDAIEPSTGLVRTFTFPESKYNEVISIKNYDRSNIVFGTRHAGACRIATEQTSISQMKTMGGTQGQSVWSSATDASLHWYATDKAGVVSSGQDQLNKRNGLPINDVFKVLVDKEKNLWIGTNGAGLSKFMGHRYAHVTSAELPGLSPVKAIVKARDKSYWAGTELSGLYNFSLEGNKVVFKKNIRSGFENRKISGLAIDKDNALWVATDNGVTRLLNGTMRSFGVGDGLIDQRVNCIYADRRNRLWIGTIGGLSLYEDGGFNNISESNGLINNEVQCVLEDKPGNIWIGTFGGLIKFDGEKLYSYFEEDGLLEKKIQCLAEGKNGNIYIGTFGGGIYRCATSGAKAQIAQLCGDNELTSNNINSLTFENDTTLIAATSQGLNKIHLTGDYKVRSISSAGRADGFSSVENSPNAALNDEENRVLWFGTPKGLTLYYPFNDKPNRVRPSIRILRMLVNGRARNFNEKMRLGYSENSVKFDFVSVSLTNPMANEYFAKLSGLDTGWNRLLINKQNLDEFVSVEYKKLQPGRYILQLKARNNDGAESDIATVKFFIRQPFYKNPWFIAGAFVIGFILIYLFFRYREKQLIREKNKLERIVTARTAEVVASKREIEAQKDLLQLQKHEIMDSINYSKRIQNAILPERRELSDRFPESFILYRPKDIVSGDFYFFRTDAQEGFYLAVADCTGHGVPGAFMSMIGSKELSEAVSESASPAQILRELNIGVRSTLKQNNLELGIKDGMDIGLVHIGKESKTGCKVAFAGANRPLWVLKRGAGNILEIKPTKAAIGGYTPDAQEFEQHNIQLRKGDSIYLFSDGYADQFGGESGKKMMTRRLKELMVECSELPMRAQEDRLRTYFDAWKGTDNEQVDDVLLIGVQL